MPAVSELGKMSKAKILQKYRPKILELGGKDELRLINETFSVGQLREYIEDFFAPGPDGKFKKGGMAKKYSKGGAIKKTPANAKGRKKLPTAVRNKMGYMSKGGTAKKKTK